MPFRAEHIHVYIYSYIQFNCYCNIAEIHVLLNDFLRFWFLCYTHSYRIGSLVLVHTLSILEILLAKQLRSKAVVPTGKELTKVNNCQPFPTGSIGISGRRRDNWYVAIVPWVTKTEGLTRQEVAWKILKHYKDDDLKPNFQTLSMPFCLNKVISEIKCQLGIADQL